MLTHIEHIGIAVKDLAIAIPLYEKLLNTPCYKTEEVASENVKTAFFAVGTNKIELLQSTTEDGLIAKYVQKKGEGIHHIAYAVIDIAAEMARLKAEGFTVSEISLSLTHIKGHQCVNEKCAFTSVFAIFTCPKCDTPNDHLADKE